jgi:hypothetical protein
MADYEHCRRLSMMGANTAIGVSGAGLPGSGTWPRQATDSPESNVPKALDLTAPEATEA